MRRASWQVRLAVLPIMVIVAAAAGVAGSHPASAGGPIAVRSAGCGTPPPAADAGRVEFAVTDDTSVFATVYLVDSANLVYAEIPWLTPGRTLPLATTLGAGRYAIRCVLSTGKVHTTSQFSVSGTTSNPVAGYKPLPDLDMTAPVNAYRAWLGAALPKLLAASQRLDADVARGDLQAAKADWLPAHLDYERLGAAYNSFGDFDAAIDGTPAGLPDGTADKNWAGLHAVEYALWHGASASDVRPLTQALVASVQGLIADFPSEEVDPGDLPLRAHEILENTLEFQITGASDAGSGTSLATAYANTEGTLEVVSVLTPLINDRDPGLPAKLGGEITALQGDLLAARDGSGTWTPAPAIGTAQRQRIDADLDQLLEDLSTIPNLLAPRTNA
ncbi:EfeM/EfeO family lipoprotein [Catenulispora pinisilvae]|uniref:EfeM/EfeO family lipoprotein n=1 Tax=Catenulispora pinisilvae TaxID=2705253 RepID=UPI0018925DB2|nr:EfeM/EfeO family lipoprotein [Catenulispora pinisilvae]